jgi:hypothetical protein
MVIFYKIQLFWICIQNIPYIFRIVSKMYKNVFESSKDETPTTVSRTQRKMIKWVFHG